MNLLDDYLDFGQIAYHMKNDNILLLDFEQSQSIQGS